MTKDDVLFGYRQQLSRGQRGRASRQRAGRSVCIAPPTITGSARSTDKAWRCCVLGSAGGHRCPNALPKMIEERIVSFSITHPGGARSQTGRLGAGQGEKWGVRSWSPRTGAWKVLPPRAQHPRQAPRADLRLCRSLRATPGILGQSSTLTSHALASLVGIDCFYVTRLKDTNGAI